MTPIIVFELFAIHILEVRPPAYGRERFFKIDPITGWAKIPNSEGYWYLYYGTKTNVRNNSHGFTDHERTIEKSKPRIVLIGDSTTEFWEVEEENRGQFILEQKLNQEWEVLNMGVRGFSTDQAYLVLQHIGIKFSPDIVIYTFCINDIYGNTQQNKPYFHFESDNKKTLVLKDFPYPYKKFPEEKKSASLIKRINKTLNQNSFLYRKASKIFKGYNSLGVYKDLPLEGQIELRPYKKIYNSQDENMKDLTLALIEEMKRFLDQQEVRFLLVEGVYGNVLDSDRLAWSVNRYGDIFDPLKVTHLFEDIAEKKGIAFLSIQDEVRRRGIPITDIMHQEDYVHLNTAGIRLYSDLVLEKLKILGWV